ncbi:type II toxin-antitoxin system RelE/ParE family toxin [Rhizobium rosettiformans]|uniref:Type II toxin-antitoxin system RelE/ParE family toxin n=1 Tax=Rhizobium rosettiformans TaxID=1368430 RepID=A0ABX7EPH9_9HYPH|nr:type II toxin-antitoxin system RelE/ParE family toxin [Rhizobium rosettiformans]QRF50235.1 type II toxin-antitoxin system RelE/ParE family toxin [Rhizobium rosettiformans]
MRIVWTRRYLRELAAIGDYLFERNPAAAARLVRSTHSRTQRLLMQNAFLGRCGEIEGNRELVLADLEYIVAYRVRDDRVEVLFVLHGARAWPE